MAYTIKTGRGVEFLDSVHEEAGAALGFARELVRQGRRNVRIHDAAGRAYTVEAFEAATAPIRRDD